MPDASDLTFHDVDCHQCEYLKNDIEEYRGKEITGQAIRFFHQEMSLLSAKAWQCVLPHYLRFCLIPAFLHDAIATEFLIYSLGPELQFQEDTLQRLSGFNHIQIDCLIDFLGWCLSQQYWKDFCPDDIGRAMNFLCTMKAKQI